MLDANQSHSSHEEVHHLVWQERWACEKSNSEENVGVVVMGGHAARSSKIRESPPGDEEAQAGKGKS